MIKLESRDGQIWNLESKVVEIINEAIATKGSIVIDFNYEGPCLRSCGFYQLLDSVTKTFNVDKSRFVIQTCNVEECHDEYKILIKDNIWLIEAKKFSNVLAQSKNPDLKTVGCFIGKTNWARLILVAWLDLNYHKQSLLTCHHNNNGEMHRSALQLSEIMNRSADDIDAATKFLKTCPRTLEKYEKNSDFLQNYNYSTSTKYQGSLTTMSSLTFGFSKVYSDIFCELVCETYYSGLTFFPTEKTFKPIIQLTPFIVFGPQGHLSNLQRCGFRTFGNYWDESYDDFAGIDRIDKIKKIISTLCMQTQTQLQDMYHDMMPILQHNQNRLSKITPGELKLG